MFDVGFWEVGIIALIALLVLGPERLPRAARTAGLWVGKARRTLAEVKRDIDREIDAADLKELKTIKDDLKETESAFKDAAKTMNEKVIDEDEFSIMPDSDSTDAPAAKPKDDAGDSPAAQAAQSVPGSGSPEAPEKPEPTHETVAVKMNPEPIQENLAADSKPAS